MWQPKLVSSFYKANLTMHTKKLKSYPFDLIILLLRIYLKEISHKNKEDYTCLIATLFKSSKKTGNNLIFQSHRKDLIHFSILIL